MPLYLHCTYHPDQIRSDQIRSDQITSHLFWPHQADQILKLPLQHSRRAHQRVTSNIANPDTRRTRHSTLPLPDVSNASGDLTSAATSSHTSCHRVTVSRLRPNPASDICLSLVVWNFPEVCLRHSRPAFHPLILLRHMLTKLAIPRRSSCHIEACIVSGSWKR